MFRFIRALIVCLGVLSVAVPATAQVQLSDRPYRGVFGGGHSLGSRHTLDFSAQLGEAYDDDVYADVGAALSPTDKRDSGYYTNLITMTNYAWKGDRVHIAVNGASTMRQYNGTAGVRLMGTTVGAGFTALVNKRTRIFANQSAAYSPSYLYGLFPGVAPSQPGDQIPVAPDYEVAMSESYTYGSHIELSHSLSSRSMVSAKTEYSYTDVSRETATRRDASAYLLAGQFSQSVAKRTTWRIGYRYRSGDVGFGPALSSKPTAEHGIDVGLDHTKVLSPTRQAVWGMTLGTSVIDVPAGVSAEVTGRVTRFSGGATFGYQFGRSWQARATYNRGLDYIPGLTAPVFADGFTAVVDGFLTDRWMVSLSSGYSTGESALYSRASTFDTYAESAKIRYALSRLWAADLEYVYYYYEFSGRTQLPVGVSPNLERNGLRIGATLWMPVLRK